MTSREELETKGIFQLMAERFAKGVPRGAYSTQSFERKAGTRDRQKKLGSSGTVFENKGISGKETDDERIARIMEAIRNEKELPDKDLVTIINAYTMDPDIRAALDDMVDSATKGTTEKLIGGPTIPYDYEHDFDPYEYVPYNALIDARNRLKLAGVSGTAANTYTNQEYGEDLSDRRFEARDVLEEKGHTRKDAEDMTSISSFKDEYHDF